MCGGTGRQPAPAWPLIGLSPRVRGNLAGVAGEAVEEGSIPACAGEPSPPVYDARPLTVYPRVCGGTICLVAASNLALGLSPRVRGNRVRKEGGRQVTRSIPACAGEPPG